MKATPIVAGSAPASAPTPGDSPARATIAAADQQAIERELHIEIEPRGGDWWQGSSAQLIAEGLVAPDFVWPRGKGTREWRDGVFHFLLERRRPEGFKGPMKAWLGCDNWQLRRRHVNNRHDGYAAAHVYRAEQELAAARRKQTPEHVVEHSRWCKALFDESFQTFKALIPCLIPPKRGRKPGKPQTVQGVQP